MPPFLLRVNTWVCLIVLLSQLWCLGLSNKAGVKIRRLFSVSISKAAFSSSHILANNRRRRWQWSMLRFGKQERIWQRSLLSCLVMKPELEESGMYEVTCLYLDDAGGKCQPLHCIVGMCRVTLLVTVIGLVTFVHAGQRHKRFCKT